jgi:uncharacterized protein (DUF1778 family)
MRQKKTERINVRVTKEEKADILKAVEKYNMKRSYCKGSISSFLIKQARRFLEER